MSCVCVWIGEPSTVAARAAELTAALLEVVPRVALEQRGVVWCDARALPGSDPRTDGARILARLAALGIDACAGVAEVPIVAELAARVAAGDVAAQHRAIPLTVVAIDSTPGIARTEAASHVRSNAPRASETHASLIDLAPTRIRVVSPGDEQEFLVPLPLSLLDPDPRIAALCDGVGVQTCGALAALDREAVEVRFGADAVPLWRLARADDPRRLFAPPPAERPHAAIEFVDYVVTDPERLVFTVNALLGSVCEALRERGEHARRMRLELPLANGETWSRSLRPARATASRERWLRMARALLERLTVEDAVAAVRIEVEATERAAAVQGDLFDRGFATAGAVEAALARLLEEHDVTAVVPQIGAHPLLERRVDWIDATAQAAQTADRVAAALTLQLLPEPRPIDVETVPRSDHEAPVRYHDGGTSHQLVVAAGPDRVSGDRWDRAYAREYFRCVTSDGVLVWLFREARRGAWYLHGWWD